MDFLIGKNAKIWDFKGPPFDFSTNSGIFRKSGKMYSLGQHEALDEIRREPPALERVLRNIWPSGTPIFVFRVYVFQESASVQPGTGLDTFAV